MKLADHVKCNWCDVESYIPLGDNVCPNCEREGFLTWANEDKQEVEIYEYRIIRRDC